MPPNAMLSKQIRNPQFVFNLHKLNLFKLEWQLNLATRPCTVLLLRLGPLFGQSKHKSTPPSAKIVAHMHNDARTCPFRKCGIATNVLDVH